MQLRISVSVLLLLSIRSLAAEAGVSIDLGQGIRMEFVRIEPGRFTQGSPSAESGRSAEETQREVTLTKAYYMARYPVTRAQWERFAQSAGYKSEAEDGKSGGYGWDGQKLTQRPEFTWRNPGFAQTGDHPVTMVTYFDAKAFAAWLSKLARRPCTLPTEAQWEYACRAGTNTPWATGSDAAAADTWAWHRGNSGNTTHPVGQKKANAWGLSDLGGQVWEWCEDWHAAYPLGNVTDPLQTNDRLSDKPRRVLRGGSFLKDAAGCRSASRYRNDPRSRNADNGFRLILADLPPPPAVPPQQLPASAPSPAQSIEKEKSPPSTVPTTTPPAPVSSPPRPAEPPRPNLHHEPTHSSKSRGGLFLLLVPAALLVWKLLRRGSKSGVVQVPTAANFTGDSTPVTRLAADGFWIGGSISPGTALSWRCRTDEKTITGDLIYQPGPEGMFVYVGRRPLEAIAWVETRTSQVTGPMTGGGGPVVRAAFGAGAISGHLHAAEEERRRRLADQEEAERNQRRMAEEQERQRRQRSAPGYPRAY